MKFAVALVTGLLSGLLVYLIAGLLVFGVAQIVFISPVIKLSIFLEGWACSVFFLVRNTKSVIEVIARAFLIGTAEWLAVILVGSLLFQRCPLIAVPLMLFCLAGFTIARFWMRERQSSAKPLWRAREAPIGLIFSQANDEIEEQVRSGGR